MNLAIKSGKLDKIAITIAKKRIKAYKAEIFQSKNKYLGLVKLFLTRYHPILIRQHFLINNKRYNLRNFIWFIYYDMRRRLKLIFKGYRNPQTFY